MHRPLGPTRHLGQGVGGPGTVPDRPSRHGGLESGRFRVVSAAAGGLPGVIDGVGGGHDLGEGGRVVVVVVWFLVEVSSRLQPGGLVASDAVSVVATLT